MYAEPWEQNKNKNLEDSPKGIEKIWKASALQRIIWIKYYIVQYETSGLWQN